MFLLMSMPLLAQDNAKLEVFGGWQYQHLGGDMGYVLGNSLPVGWNASVTGKINKHLGVTADFSGNYKSYTNAGIAGHTHLYTFTGGPVYSLNSESKFNPFVHVLFGGAHVSAPYLYNISTNTAQYTSSNGFTTMFGGGVDYKAKKNIAVRLAQFDWVYYHFSGRSYAGNVRYSSGVVFHF